MKLALLRLKFTPDINQDFIWASQSSILVALFEQVEIAPPNRIVGRDAASGIATKHVEE